MDQTRQRDLERQARALVEERRARLQRTHLDSRLLYLCYSQAWSAVNGDCSLRAWFLEPAAAEPRCIEVKL